MGKREPEINSLIEAAEKAASELRAEKKDELDGGGGNLGKLQEKLVSHIKALRKYLIKHNAELDDLDKALLSGAIVKYQAIQDNPINDGKAAVLPMLHDAHQKQLNQQITGYTTALYGNSSQRAAELVSLRSKTNSPAALAEYGKRKAALNADLAEARNEKVSPLVSMRTIREQFQNEQKKAVPDPVRMAHLKAEYAGYVELEKQQTRQFATEITAAVVPINLHRSRSFKTAYQDRNLEGYLTELLGPGFRVETLANKGNNMVCKVTSTVDELAVVVKVGEIDTSLVTHGMSYLSPNCHKVLQCRTDTTEIYHSLMLADSANSQVTIAFEVSEYISHPNLQQANETSTASFPKASALNDAQILEHQKDVLADMRLVMIQPAELEVLKIYNPDIKPSNCFIIPKDPMLAQNEQDTKELKVADKKTFIDTSKTSLTKNKELKRVNPDSSLNATGDTRDLPMTTRICLAQSLLLLLTMSPENMGGQLTPKVTDSHDPKWATHPMLNKGIGKEIADFCQRLVADNPRMSLSAAIQEMDGFINQIDEIKSVEAQRKEILASAPKMREDLLKLRDESMERRRVEVLQQITREMPSAREQNSSTSSTSTTSRHNNDDDDGPGLT